jgi:hypothetical protein
MLNSMKYKLGIYSQCNKINKTTICN